MIISSPGRSYSSITLDLKEQSPFNFESIKEKLYSCLNENDIYFEEEEISNALFNDIENWKTGNIVVGRKSSPIKYQFDYVGLLLPRETNKKIAQSNKMSLPKDILFFIYPKWANFSKSSDDRIQMRTTTINSIIRYVIGKKIESNLRSRFTSNYEDPSMMIELLFGVVEFTNRNGILQEQDIKRTKRIGIEDWSSTFAVGKPMFSSGKPYYAIPIRKKKTNIFTELSKVHQEIYNYCITYLLRFIPMRRKMKFRSRVDFSARELRTMKKVIRTVLLRTKTHKHKEKIRILKNFVEYYSSMRHQKSMVFGLSSGSFDKLWERALLETFGDATLTRRINDLFIENRMMIGSKKASEKKSLEIDGANKFGNQIILFDAKNYANWETIDTSVLHKQYLYEYGINFFIQEGHLSATNVQKNAFIFPKNPSHILATDPDFQLVGSYSQPFLTELSNLATSSMANPNPRSWEEGILAIEVQGFYLLRKYTERNGRVEDEFLLALGLGSSV